MGVLIKNGKSYTGGNGIGLVQSGHLTFTLTGQNLEQQIPITFPIPFKEVPNITLSLSDPSRGQYYNPQTGLGVMSPSITGFNLLIKSSSSAVAGDITIYWIASSRIAGDIDADYHRYSTEEHIVGEWIDGSTLYEKTWEVSHTFIYGDNDIELQSNVDFVSSDIKTYDTTIVLSNGYATKKVSVLPDDTLYVNSSNKLIMYFSCNNASSVGTRTVRVTAQYTKSTS